MESRIREQSDHLTIIAISAVIVCMHVCACTHVYVFVCVCACVSVRVWFLHCHCTLLNNGDLLHFLLMPIQQRYHRIIFFNHRIIFNVRFFHALILAAASVPLLWMFAVLS